MMPGTYTRMVSTIERQKWKPTVYPLHKSSPMLRLKVTGLRQSACRASLRAAQPAGHNHAGSKTARNPNPPKQMHVYHYDLYNLQNVIAMSALD
jgi:hypothetical protein